MSSRYDREYNRELPDDPRAPEIAPYRNKKSRRRGFRASSAASVLATVSVIAAIVVTLTAAAGFFIDRIAHDSAFLNYDTTEENGFLPEDAAECMLLEGEDIIRYFELPVPEKSSLLMSGLSADTEYTAVIFKNGEEIERLPFRTLPYKDKTDDTRYEPDGLRPPDQVTSIITHTATNDYFTIEVTYSANDAEVTGVTLLPGNGDEYPLTRTDEGYGATIAVLDEGGGEYHGFVRIEYTLGGEPGEELVDCMFTLAGDGVKKTNPKFVSIETRQEKDSYDVTVSARIDPMGAQILSVLFEPEKGMSVPLVFDGETYSGIFANAPDGRYNATVSADYRRDGESGQIRTEIPVNVDYILIAPEFEDAEFSQAEGALSVEVTARVQKNDGEILSLSLDPGDGTLIPMTEDGGSFRAVLDGLSDGEHTAAFLLEYRMPGAETSETLREERSFTVSRLSSPLRFDSLTASQDMLSLTSTAKIAFEANDSALNSIDVTVDGKKVGYERNANSLGLPELSVGNHTVTVTLSYTTAGQADSASRSCTLKINPLPVDMAVVTHPVSYFDGTVQIEESFVPNDAENISAVFSTHDRSRSVSASVDINDRFFEATLENVSLPAGKIYAIYFLDFTYTLGGYRVEKNCPVLVYDSERADMFPGYVSVQASRTPVGNDYMCECFVNLNHPVTLTSFEVFLQDGDDRSTQRTLYSLSGSALTANTVSDVSFTFTPTEAEKYYAVRAELHYLIDGYAFTMSEYTFMF